MPEAAYLPIEPTFNDFVEKLGGQLIEKILPPREGEKRADYLFRNPCIVAELKCLERDLLTPEYVRKLQAVADNWQARNLIRIYGTTMIELRKLPLQCQQEWRNLIEQPLNRQVVTRANRQIRETKVALALPNATGVVLLANDGNRSLTPADIFTFLARILSKRKPNGKLVCSSTQWIVLFSTNVGVVNSSDPRAMTFWKAGHRLDPANEAVSKFLADMSVAWNRHCAEKRGVPLKEVDVSGVDFEKVRFA